MERAEQSQFLHDIRTEEDAIHTFVIYLKNESFFRVLKIIKGDKCSFKE